MSNPKFPFNNSDQICIYLNEKFKRTRRMCYQYGIDDDIMKSDLLEVFMYAYDYLLDKLKKSQAGKKSARMLTKQQRIVRAKKAVETRERKKRAF